MIKDFIDRDDSIRKLVDTRKNKRCDVAGLQTAIDDPTLLIWRPSYIKAELPFVLFMRLSEGQVQLDSALPLKCQEVPSNVDSILSLVVAKKEIIYAQIHNKNMVIQNDIFLGHQLSQNAWKSSRMNDLYFEITLFPEFDKEKFPYAVGLNSD
jgi:hypothetical protein